MNQESTQQQTSEVQKSTSNEKTITPFANIYESEDSILLELDMPGVSNDKLEINFDKDQLIIRGEATYPEYEGYKAIHREFQVKTYLRKFVVNKPIEIDKTQAMLHQGRLKITLFKQVPVVKKIQVVAK